MDYIKIRFGNDFGQDELSAKKASDELFHQSMNKMFYFSGSVWKPHMDIFETPDEIIIQAEIAGVEKENLEIEINNQAVKISGKRVENSPVENSTYRLVEIQHGSFERVLCLPSAIDTEKVSASYSNGFLQVNLAKNKQDES